MIFYSEDKRKRDVTEIVFILDHENEELFQNLLTYGGSP